MGGRERDLEGVILVVEQLLNSLQAPEPHLPHARRLEYLPPGFGFRVSRWFVCCVPHGTCLHARMHARMHASGTCARARQRENKGQDTERKKGMTQGEKRA